jgi:acetate kinase
MTLVLVLNTGSSSVKFQLIDTADGARRGGVVEEVGDHDEAVRRVVAELRDAAVELVGHRVVHGGEEFSTPTLLDDDVVARLRRLVPLAPLHNPANLAGIEAARRAWPDVAHVAVFDTAFHSTLEPHAYRYAVPAAWYAKHQVRRYGFHGTSVAYVSARAAEVLGQPLDELDLIVAHLGNGASVTAVHRGSSVETSMGLSPLEGLVMGTRSGDVDPTVVAHVAAATGRPVADVLDELSTASGLLGLCGDSDVRRIEERLQAADADAVLAVEVFCHRVKKYLGAYLAVLGRCDAVVFTGGIGEHSDLIRRRACEGLGGLGISLGDGTGGHGPRVISGPGSPIAVLVVPTDEELEIAQQAVAATQAFAVDPDLRR